MIVINELGVSHGARTLFAGANVVFGEGGRYGIVGANGAGKSTLLRVISGQEEATSGTVSIPQRKRVGVLSQDHFQYEEVPIIEVVMMGLPELWDAMSEEQRIELSRHELASIASVGLWFEIILMQMMLRDVYDQDPRAQRTQYALTEIGDEKTFEQIAVVERERFGQLVR